MDFKLIAHAETTKAVRNGHLPPIEEMPCADCGSQSQVRHHEDYSKPVEVVYLCQSCHMRRHRELGWGAAGRPKDETRCAIRTISMPPDVLQFADQQARQQKRSFSNYIVTLIERDRNTP